MHANSQRDLVTYGQNDAIVFDGGIFPSLVVFPMLTPSLAYVLARHFVQLPGAPARSSDESLFSCAGV